MLHRGPGAHDDRAQRRQLPDAVHGQVRWPDRGIVASFKRASPLDYLWYTVYETLDPNTYSNPANYQDCAEFERDGRPSDCSRHQLDHRGRHERAHVHPGPVRDLRLARLRPDTRSDTIASAAPGGIGARDDPRQRRLHAESRRQRDAAGERALHQPATRQHQPARLRAERRQGVLGDHADRAERKHGLGDRERRRAADGQSRQRPDHLRHQRRLAARRPTRPTTSPTRTRPLWQRLRQGQLHRRR